MEHAVYKRRRGTARILVGIYVDDLIITGESKTDIVEFKGQMNEKFQMSDLGMLSYYLGIEVRQLKGEITLCQESFARKILKDCGMLNCNPTRTPMEAKLKLSKNSDSPPADSNRYRSVVGSLRYLLHTRPDLAFSVGFVSRFMEDPRTEHMNAVKHILRYIKGTTGMGTVYRRNEEEDWELVGFSDSDLAGDQNDRKSTSGMIFFLGRNPVSWSSKKQRVVALSSCEAEYIAAASAACQGIWLEGLVADLLDQNFLKVKLKIDNMSAISLCKNPVFHERSKHIDMRFHYIRQNVENGRIGVEHVNTQNQLADIMTKPLGRVQFIELRNRINIQEVKKEATSLGE